MGILVAILVGLAFIGMISVFTKQESQRKLTDKLIQENKDKINKLDELQRNLDDELKRIKDEQPYYFIGESVAMVKKSYLDIELKDVVTDAILMVKPNQQGYVAMSKDQLLELLAKKAASNKPTANQ